MNLRIAADRYEVAQLTRLVGCVSRFNALMTRYEHRAIQSRVELNIVKGELRSIQSVANASKREHASDSSARRTLDELTGAITSVLEQLPA